MTDKPKCETCQAWKCNEPNDYDDGIRGICFLTPHWQTKKTTEWCMQHIPIEERKPADHKNPTHAEMNSDPGLLIGGEIRGRVVHSRLMLEQQANARLGDQDNRAVRWIEEAVLVLRDILDLRRSPDTGVDSEGNAE